MNTCKKASTFLLAAALGFASTAAPKRTIEAQRQELDVLKQYLQQGRDSLQTEITNRWRYKQRYVEQRELDKEQMSRGRDLQERSFSELSRIKEEVFAKERLLEDEKKDVAAHKDDWEYVGATFDETLDKEAQALEDRIPLGLESRRKDLEKLRREFRNNKNVSTILPEFEKYHTKYLQKGGVVTLDRQVVMPDEGDPQEMRTVTFGNVFAYGLNDLGDPFIIRQTGKLGADRYAIEKVGAPALKTQLQKDIPEWDKNASITGDVVVDVMQNDNTGILVSGKKVNMSTKIITWLKAGGPVLFPLIILMAWAMVLVVLKLRQYSIKHKRNKDFYQNVAKLLDSKENDKAYEYAKSKKGVVAKVIRTCLEHSKWNRTSAEKAVREILIDEVPQLEKHLATLAVIAGAAPLLGLLGTVTGMISLFQVITHYGTGDPKIMAGGISEALITTQTGLSVAIPILLVHNALRNRSQFIQTEIEKHAIRILNRLWPEA